MRLGKTEISLNLPGIHKLLYVFFLMGIAASMPLSKYVPSLFQFLLIIHWIVRGDYAEKWERLKSRKAIWILSLFLIIPLIGMIYSQDWAYGLKDIKIKLPLLALPLIIGTSEIISKQQFKYILLAFSASVSISSLVSLGIISGIFPYTYTDIRETSIFISHIRLALLVDLAIFTLSFYSLRQETKRYERIGFFGWILYLLIYLITVKALTGLVIGFLAGLVLSVRWLILQKDIMVKWFALVGIITLPLLTVFYISWKVNDFYTIKDDIHNLDPQTVKGNPYWHDTTNLYLENGYHTGLYVCEEEMREAWNGISNLDYDGKDKKEHEIRFTLIRYLTSMGLRKDAYGVSQLGNDDINLIESGFANHIYKKRNHFNVRMYELIWEIDVYRKGGNPSGHSLTQRIEYFRTGFAIFKDHPLFGVGTGDVPSAFNTKYEESQSRLDPKWRLRAHNQWLTFAISFGLIGFLILVIAFILPGFFQKKYGQYFFMLIFMVSFLSMFNEDTLETQAGVAFFAFFYPFLLFSPDHRN